MELLVKCQGFGGIRVCSLRKDASYPLVPRAHDLRHVAAPLRVRLCGMLSYLAVSTCSSVIGSLLCLLRDPST